MKANQKGGVANGVKLKVGDEDVFTASLSSAALAKDTTNPSRFANEKVEVGVDPIRRTDAWCIALNQWDADSA